MKWRKGIIGYKKFIINFKCHAEEQSTFTKRRDSDVASAPCQGRFFAAAMQGKELARIAYAQNGM